MIHQLRAFRALTSIYVQQNFGYWLPTVTGFMTFCFDLFLFGTFFATTGIGRGLVFASFFLSFITLDVLMKATYMMFLSRFKRDITGTLSSPVRDWVALAAIYVSVLIRTLVLSLWLICAGFFLLGVNLFLPLQLFSMIFLITIIFCSIGIIDGIRAHSFNTAGIVTSTIFRTSWYFSGALFPIPFKNAFVTFLIKINPTYYLANMFKYYTIGKSDFIPSMFHIAILTLVALLGVFLVLRDYLTNKNIRY